MSWGEAVDVAARDLAETLELVGEAFDGIAFSAKFGLDGSPSQPATAVAPSFRSSAQLSDTAATDAVFMASLQPTSAAALSHCVAFDRSAEEEMDDSRIGEHLFRPVEHPRSPQLQDQSEIRNLQRRARVLLDQQHRHAAIA